MSFFKFNKKNKSGFKVGDYVRVNDGIKIETGEIINNWGGQITEIYSQSDTYNISFDAITLDGMSDEYLLMCDKDGCDEYSYNFQVGDFTLMERRDTDEELKRASSEYRMRFALLTDDLYSWEEEMQEKWFDMFSETRFFEQLTEHQKENADFAIHVFTHYYMSYMDQGLLECTTDDAEYMCTDILSRKVTAERDFYEALGPIIAAFFEFMGEKEYFSEKDAQKIKKHILSIQDKIVKASENPNNWGMAKSMMMRASEQGYDMSSQEDMDAFLRVQQLNALQRLQQEQGQLQERDRQLEQQSKGFYFSSKPHINQDPYKDFGRNTKVSVSYPEGKTKENVSFKRVEKDLRSGKCTLI